MPPKTHEVIDGQSGRPVGSYSSLRRASRAADRLDLDYGAVRYHARRIHWPDQPLADTILATGPL